jgi:hypothetical protein
MKINFVQTSIAIALSFLLAYGFYSFNKSENKLVLGIGSFIFLASTLVVMIAMNFELNRTTSNIRVVSSVFFVFGLIINLIFSFILFSIASYIITNGIFLLLFLLIIFSINRLKQI